MLNDMNELNDCRKLFRVDFETAKLLTQLTYDYPCDYHYDKDGNLDLYFNESTETYVAPIVAEVVYWLLQKYSIVFNYYTDVSQMSRYEIKCHTFDKLGNVSKQPIASVSIVDGTMCMCEKEAINACLKYLMSN